MNLSTGTQPDIPIIYEDDHLLVIDKPANVLSQKDRTGDPDVLTLCKGYLANKPDAKGSGFVGLVHRLDRPVSGVMVLAKSSNAASGLSGQMRSGSIKKVYHAVVHGKPPPNGVFVHHLEKDSRLNLVTVSSPEIKSAKRAELNFVRIAFHEESDLSLVKIHLITGRSHQIRVQFSTEGFPVSGDSKYATRATSDHNLALQSSQFIANHPLTVKTLNFSLPLPPSSPWSLFK